MKTLEYRIYANGRFHHERLITDKKKCTKEYLDLIEKDFEPHLKRDGIKYRDLLIVRDLYYLCISFYNKSDVYIEHVYELKVGEIE